MKNSISYLLLFITAGFVHNQVMAQTQTTQKIYIGMYCLDRDNDPSSPTYQPGLEDGLYPDIPDHIGYDVDYISELKKYNYNLIIGIDPSYKEVTSGFKPDTLFLNRIQDSGLKIIIRNKNFDVIKPRFGDSDPDPNIYACYLSTLSSVANSSQVNYGLLHYNSHPAIVGYHIADEPCRTLESGVENSCWNAVAGIENQINTFDNNKIRYVNLWPDPEPTWQGLLELNGGCSALDPDGYGYEDYLTDYLSITNPNMISFDRYPLMSPNPEYNTIRRLFHTLDLHATKAKENDIPFYYVTNAFESNIGCCTYEALTNEQYLSFNIYSAMIHGAKGIMYWQREGHSGGSPYDATSFWGFGFENTADEIKQNIGEIHEKILNHAAELGRLKYERCYHVTELPYMGLSNYHYSQIYNSGTNWYDFLSDSRTNYIFNTTTPITPPPTVSAPSSNPSDYLALSYLSDNSTDNVYLWAMNKNIYGEPESNESFTFNFNGPKNVVEVLEDKLCFGANSITFELAPGEAKLFLIRNANVAVQSIGSAYYEATVTIATSTINLTSTADISNSSKISFLANQITLNTGVWIHPETEVLLRSENDYCGTFSRLASEEKVKKVIEVAAIKAMPNPNNGDFIVEVSGDPEKMYLVTVSSILGQVVYTKQIPGNSKLDIQLTNLADGVFLTTLKSDGEVIQTLKTIVTH